MRCMECGANNDDGVRFCTNCGTDLMAADPAYIPHNNAQSKRLPVIVASVSVTLLVIAVAVMLVVFHPWEKESTNEQIEQTPSVGGESQTGLVKAVKVVLSFEGGSATGGSTSSISALEGEQVILPKCGFIYEDHEFHAWIDDSGAEYEPGDTLTLTKDLTLTAKWTSVSTSEPQSTNNGASSVPASTKATDVSTTTEAPAAPTPASTFPRKWSGTYIGTSSYVGGDGHISRAVAFDFTTVSDTGYLEGVCYVGADETGPGTTYGTCYVSGNVDWSSGTINFQGTNWIDQGGLGDLREYSGTVDFSAASMGGSARDVGTGLYETPWNVHAVEEIAIWQNGSLTTVS